MIRIKAENRWFRRFSRQNSLDLVISDNRYGLHASGVTSVLMTHQLAIRTGLGAFVDGWVRRLNYRLLNRFDTCWVPDIAGSGNLAGALAHPPKMPAVPVRYIGWLSRLAANNETTEPKEPTETIEPTEPIDLLVLLSGPEPQRTILEKLILGELSALSGKRIVLLRGLPQGAPQNPPQNLPQNLPGHVTCLDHANATEMSKLIAASRLIVSRPGYSTVMDLAKLGKRAVFIPTPGQTEQEYLGRHLAEKGWAITMDQRKFSLKAAMQQSESTRAKKASESIQVSNKTILNSEITRLLLEIAQSKTPPDLG